MRASLPFALVAALTLACGASSPRPTHPAHSYTPGTPLCSGGDKPLCVGPPVCQYDEEDQCQACQCDAGMQSGEQIRAGAAPR